MMRDFLKFVTESALVLFDGAMGTQLVEAGLEPGPGWNLERPDVVLDIHKRYLQAGADVLITNTLTANRLALTRAGLADQLVELNAAGVGLARQAAGEKGFVAGDMSSTGEFLEPVGTYSSEQFLRVYREQARALAEADIDLFIIQTVYDPKEMCLAIEACKEVADLPVVASMAFDKARTQYRTMMGSTVADCVRSMVGAGADVVGANCGSVTPEEMAEIIEQMHLLTALPLIAQPNAGRPQMLAGKESYRLSPEDFARGMKEVIASGAELVGGCCGTTPEHIKLLADELRGGGS